jgi:hypothetical protein
MARYISPSPLPPYPRLLAGGILAFASRPRHIRLAFYNTGLGRLMGSYWGGGWRRIPRSTLSNNALTSLCQISNYPLTTF